MEHREQSVTVLFIIIRACSDHPSVFSHLGKHRRFQRFRLFCFSLWLVTQTQEEYCTSGLTLLGIILSLILNLRVLIMQTGITPCFSFPPIFIEIFWILKLISLALANYSWLASAKNFLMVSAVISSESRTGSMRDLSEACCVYPWVGKKKRVLLSLNI